MNTEIANAVNAAGDKAQYDTRVKRLLAQKSILAHILVKTVDEFKGMKPEDVVKYIEGEPSIRMRNASRPRVWSMRTASSVCCPRDTTRCWKATVPACPRASAS